MITYVFGAGASRHAGYPLAGELGNRLHAWIRRNGPVAGVYGGNIEKLHELSGGLGDIEPILTDLEECTPGSPAAELQPRDRASCLKEFYILIPEFFNDLRDGPAPLYDRWSRERVSAGDVVIMFNYDVACERELKKAGLWEISNGYGFSLELDAIPPSKVKVLKLHGSTNWLDLIFGGNTGASSPSSVFGERPAIFRREDLEFFGYSNLCDPLCACIPRTGGRPCLILPALRKSFHDDTLFGRERTQFWQSLWTQAAQALESSDRIVIIGYRMAAVDEAAKRLLLERSNPDAHIGVFCGQSSAAICSEFNAHGFQPVETRGKGHFEDYLGR